MMSSATLLRFGAAVALAVSGYIHATLYLDGYRAIPLVGNAFLLQAGASLAIAVLLLSTDSPAAQVPAAALAAGSLVAFALSRTVGVLGFVERGWQPSPQALTSVLAEVLVLVLLGVSAAEARRRAQGPAGNGVGTRP